MNEWIAAGIAAGAGLVLGTIFGRLTQNALSKEKRPEGLRSVAAPIGSLVFSVFLIAGLMTALGFVNKEALDQIPTDLVDYIPNLLSAVIVLIGANVIAQLAQTAIERTVARMPGNAAKNVPNLTRIVILTFGAILAAAQLGVDTTVINIAIAAILFSIGLGAALMVGLGSHTVTGEVAAGRAIRRMIDVGDAITIGEVSGTVVAVQSVAIEIDTTAGTVLVPHTHLLEERVSIDRTSRTADASD